MLKHRSIIEFEVNGRTYRLECASQSPLEDVHQALMMMQDYVKKIGIPPPPEKESQEKEEECKTESCKAG